MTEFWFISFLLIVIEKLNNDILDEFLFYNAYDRTTLIKYEK